jgi:4-amino-4-deoxy-L-arabinose transferase-like glycosyltransferase
VDHFNTTLLSAPEPVADPGREPALAPVRAAPWPPRLSWLILAGVALLYAGTCFTPVIFDDNEGLYAGSVREMHQRGDWLVPMSNGFPRVQKPPLVYWTMLVSTSIFGGNEFGLRLPNALATAGWIAATCLIMRRWGGERFGLASALALASMLGVWVFTHLVQPEPFLALFISLAFWCLVEARAGAASPDRAGRWYLLFWIFLALGTMSKGLHGALWPLATAGLAAILFPGWRPWLRPILDRRGVLAFLVIVAPWYIYMAANFPGFLSAHFLNEQLGASLNTRFPPDARQLSMAQFYLQHLLFWLPWTLLLPASIATALRARREARDRPGSNSAPARDIARLLACWVGLVMVSVAFSTRQDYYSMSCWGAVAAFFAWPWMAQESASIRLPRAYLVVPCLLIAVVGAGSLGFAEWLRPHLASLGEATAAPIRNRDTFLDAITGISPALWGRFISLLAIFGATALLAGIASGALAWSRRFFPAFLVLAGSVAVPVVLAAIGFTMMSPYFSLAENARAINRAIASQPDAVVACDALPNTASSLLWYLNARVHWVDAPFNNQYAQRVLGLGRDYYWDDAETARIWRSSTPVYLIVDQGRLPHWRALLLPAPRILHAGGTRLVLANR